MQLTFDIQPYLWQDDPWPKENMQEVQRIYDEKFRLANLLKPKKVLEIGVRAGYSAACFLASGTQSYIGIEATDTWGGTPWAVEFAKHMLPLHFPDANIEILNQDSQLLSGLSYTDVDLVHVDGDHSLTGCLHDLELAYTLHPQWILVDDIFHHPESCMLAAHAFAALYNFRHLVFPTLRGDMLLEVT